jgi:hypothetical protein
MSEEQRRLALLDLWVYDAVLSHALFLPTTPSDWLDAPTGAKINRTKATFPTFVQDLVGTKWFNANLKVERREPDALGEFPSQDVRREPDRQRLHPPGSEDRGSN